MNNCHIINILSRFCIRRQNSSDERVPSMATSFHCGISTRVTRSLHGRCIQRRNIGSILNYLQLTDTAHLCSFDLKNQLRSRYGRQNLINTRYIFYCQSKHANVLCATKLLYDNLPELFMPVLKFFLTYEIHVVVVTFTEAHKFALMFSK